MVVHTQYDACITPLTLREPHLPDNHTRAIGSVSCFLARQAPKGDNGGHVRARACAAGVGVVLFSARKVVVFSCRSPPMRGEFSMATGVLRRRALAPRPPATGGSNVVE